jgi:3-hydroxybutyrate dehydrogenase
MNTNIPSAPRATAAAAVDLRGRTALVTGGSSGIGLACSRRLARAGAKVIVVGRSHAARNVAEEIGGEAYQVDLSDPRVLAELNLVADILVNNAGIQQVTPVHEFPPETFQAMQRLMVEAPFRLIRSSLPHMYEQGYGRIINISSAHGLRASPYKVGYVTAKHALEGMSKVVAIEGAPHGVTSNCVNPGYVRTALVQKQIADQAVAHGVSENEVLTQVLLADNPVKRMAEPEEVAELVVYLCSPDASYITGAALSIDGGWTAG